MSYLAKQRLSYYKKYKIDIWGFVHNTLQVLEDNTFYKRPKTFTTNKALKYSLKQTKNKYHVLKARVKRAKENYNDKLKAEMEKLSKLPKKNLAEVLKKFKSFKDFKNYWKRDYEKFKKKNESFKEYNYLQWHRIRTIKKLIILNNIWNVFIKHTISKRLSNIFDVMIEIPQEETKIFYRRRFIYEPRIPMGTKRKKKVKEQFFSVRLIQLFYIIYTLKQLKRISLKAKLKDGVFEHNLMTIIESKLPSFIYRCALFPTLFESLDFVKTSNVWVNKKYKPLIYYQVKLYDIVGFRPFYKTYILWSFFKRLRRKAFLFLFPQCIYISLTFLFIVLIKRITMRDIINAFNFDYYRVDLFNRQQYLL